MALSHNMRRRSSVAILACVAVSSSALAPPKPTPDRFRKLRSGELDRRTFLLVSVAAAAQCNSPSPASASTWENPFAPADRAGLKSKPLETLRILLQDEADAIQYGGNEGLAPGGAPPASGLLLIPIVQMRQTLAGFEPVLKTFDGTAWGKAKTELSMGNFQTLEFKKVFNAFSDNIYYTSETAEANAYLLGGATPSTSQTYQYLQRNEALKQLGDLRDEIDYQLRQPEEKREVDYAQDLLAAALKAFDGYLKLAPPDQLRTARTALNLE